MTAREITHILHSRSVGNAIVLLTVAAMALLYLLCQRPLPGNYLLAGLPGCVTGLLSILTAGVLLQFINKQYNMLRSDTALPVALFVTFVVMFPVEGYTLSAGSLLVVTMMAVTALLFSSYGDSSQRRRIFMIFAIVTAMGIVSLSFLYYIPILLVGCVQMRIFNFKTLVAALLGVITPPWIVFGFGLATFSDFEFTAIGMPQWEIDSRATLIMLLVIGFVVMLGVFFAAANILKIYSFNARVRSFNGFYTFLFLWTVLLTVFDYDNITTYMLLLMAMAAYQAGMFFGLRANIARSWIGIALIALACWSSTVIYCLYD